VHWASQMNVPDRKAWSDLNRTIPSHERVVAWEEQNIDHVIVLEQPHTKLDRIEGIDARA